MSRSLPERPSLRHLKLEAKRRLADGEFGTLHEAQTAIAREYGEPSWAALKRLVGEYAYSGSHAFAQLRWLTGQFAQAGRPGWAPPGDEEMLEHFAAEFLSVVTVTELAADLTKMGPALGGTPRVLVAEPLQARIELGGLDIVAAVQDAPPHRITGLRVTPAFAPVSDARLATPPAPRTSGNVPAAALALAAGACAELGLPGLALAGGAPDGAPGWVVTAGWRDLDRGEVLDPAHLFAAPGVSALVTATTVLRLVADGAVGLDDAANAHLRTVRLADDTVTVRDLLSHAGGLDDPAELFGPAVRDLPELTGPVIRSVGRRGTPRPSNGGIAALGQLVADATGEAFPVMATRLVLEPLGMTRSWYPMRAADLGDDAVTGYDVGQDGQFRPLPAAVCTIPAIGGLWTSAGDLLVLATEWASLLPPALARAALAPQASSPGLIEFESGLGWLLRPGGFALHAGSGPGCTAAVGLRIDDGYAHVVLTSRMAPVTTVLDRLRQS